MRAATAKAHVASLVVLALTQQLRHAEARPLVSKMSCRKAAEVVTKKGAAVLATSGVTFDRYVRDQSFCDRGEQLTPSWTPTADNPICFIGYTCGGTIGGIP
jgi:hypothetical protein